MSLLVSVPQGKRPKILKEYRKDQFLESYISLMEICWDNDPSKRPDFKMISKNLKMLKNY